VSERARGDDGDRAEVEHWSDVYEDALRRHDVATLDALFWDDPAVLRFGVADQQCGYGEVVTWRAGATPISPDRVITARHVVALAPGVVAVDLTFADDDATIGRQSQTWIRVAAGWRIARAHVSVIPTR
jgi:hypothetical protein